MIYLSPVLISSQDHIIPPHSLSQTDVSHQLTQGTTSVMTVNKAGAPTWPFRMQGERHRLDFMGNVAREVFYSKQQEEGAGCPAKEDAEKDALRV